MLQATTEAAVCAYGCAHAGGAAVFQIAYTTNDGVAAHVPPRCPSRRGERGDGVENNAIAGHMPVTQLWSTALAGGVKGCEYHVIADALVHIIDSCVAYCARHRSAHAAVDSSSVVPLIALSILPAFNAGSSGAQLDCRPPAPNRLSGVRRPSHSSIPSSRYKSTLSINA